MPPRLSFRVSTAAIGITLVSLVSGPASALTLMQGGYSSTPFLTLESSDTRMEIGADGVLYLLRAGGITRVTPDGVESPWSAASVTELAVLPSGGAYGAGGTSCMCLVRIGPDGSYSTFAEDSIQWSSVALGPNGTIYARGHWAPLEGGIFQLDPLTGDRTLVVGVDLSRDYVQLENGADGYLYAIEKVWQGAAYVYHLARLDGLQFTPLALLPYGGYQLARGWNDDFWVTTGWDYGSGYPTGELWEIDTASGTSTLFARVGWQDSRFWGVACDLTNSRLYVGDPSHRLLQPQPVIYAVTGGAVPTRSVSWGSIKARYR